MPRQRKSYTYIPLSQEHMRWADSKFEQVQWNHPTRKWLTLGGLISDRFNLPELNAEAVRNRMYSYWVSKFLLCTVCFVIIYFILV